MADPFGIIGVLGVAAKITATMVKLGLDWKDAPTEAQSFRAELQTLKTILSETSTNILLNQEFLYAFQGQPSALLSQLGPPAYGAEEEDAAFTDTTALVSICRKELEKLLSDLNRRLEGSRFGWERLKAAFLAKNTRDSMIVLSRQCDLLNRLLAIDSAALAARIHAQLREAAADQAARHEEQIGATLAVRGRVDSMVARQSKFEDDETRRKLLEWLTSVEFASQQADFIHRRTPETGGWLLSSTEYESWVKSDGGSVLFCPGIPGAGKTMSASILIDDLHTRQFPPLEQVAVAWVYCNFKRQDEQKLDALLLSLLRQLTSSCSEIPAAVSSMQRTCLDRGSGARPSVPEILSALQAVCSSIDRVFLVIDALDECQTEEQCRAQFLDAVLDLTTKGNVNLFATSRFIPDIVRSFDEKKATKMEIRATAEDVRKYLVAEMGVLPGFVKRSPPLKEQIITAIVDAVDGMFLLAALHLNSLVGKRSPAAIKTALTRLPSGSEAYDKAYKEAMLRIEGQVHDLEHLAKEVLSWITCAERPLQTQELQHALSVAPGATEFDPDSLPDIEDMVSCCAGLVVIDDESNIIRLVHYTTQEFFERTRHEWFPDAEFQIAEACVTYISFSNFSTGPCETQTEFDERLKIYSLYDYAGLNWGHHARRSAALTSTVSSTVLDFLTLESSKRREATLQVKFQDANLNVKNFIIGFVPKQVCGLHLAAFFGLQQATKALLDSGYYVNTLDSWEWTPLFYAALVGATETAKTLLASPLARVDTLDYASRSALRIAIDSGHADVAKVILSTGLANRYLKENKKALVNAVERDHVSLVQLLIDHGVDVNFPSENPPLDRACHLQRVEIVKLLLARPEIELNPSKTRSHPAFISAISSGSKEVVELVLGDYRVDVHTCKGGRHTALCAAVVYRNMTALKILLARRDVSPNSPNADGLTPLYLAIARGNDEAMKILSAVSEIPSHLESKLDTARLHAAVRAGDETLVRALFAKGTHPNTSYPGSTPPIYEAISSKDEEGHIGVMKAFLEQPDFDVNQELYAGRTALSVTASWRRFGFMKLLLARDDIDAGKVDDQGRSDLYWATMWNDADTIRRLLALPLRAGVDPNKMPLHDRDTPLIYAAERNLSDVAELLLADPRTKPDLPNWAGVTALSMAAQKGFDGIVTRLLDRKDVDINSRDKKGNTPLMRAIRYRKIETIRLLLEKGADANIPNNKGLTPRARAGLASQSTIVKMLKDHGAKEWCEEDDWVAVHWAEHRRRGPPSVGSIFGEDDGPLKDYYGFDLMLGT